MLEKRPIVVLTIGYIIGIISGLYCNVSIAFMYAFAIVIYFALKKPHKIEIRLKKYIRFSKIIFTKNVIIWIIMASTLSNTYILYLISKTRALEGLENKTIQVEVQVISDDNEKEYSNIYKAKVSKVVDTEVDKILENDDLSNRNCNYKFEKLKYNKLLKNKTVYIKVKKKNKLKYGSKINITGTFSMGKTRTNYKGFNYRNYLKSKGIYGIIQTEEIISIDQKTSFSVGSIINILFNKIKKIIKANFSKKNANVLLGITLGYTEEMDENMQEDFSNNNILHIVAVSGMHVGYIILFCKVIFGRVLSKTKTYIVSIIFLLFYMVLTGEAPSVVRATIMASLVLFSKIIYKKSDVWTNISLSLLVLLIINPFSINDTGLLLSYVGTLGIIIYTKLTNFKSKVINAIGTTISVFIFILPILIVSFHKIPIISLLISIIIGILVGPIIFLGFSFILLKLLQELKYVLIFQFISKFIFNMFLEFILKNLIGIITNILIFLTKIGNKIPLNKIYVCTPNLLKIIIYYLIIFISIFIYKSNKCPNMSFKRRIKNILNSIKYKYKNKIIAVSLCITIFFSFWKITFNNLKIYFIDVGQGDSCLVVTPMNKKILIDGGGSEEYNIGKNVLIPYLLDRGIKKLDYIIISHFDSDHYLGCEEIIREMSVKNVIISKIGEDSYNFKRFKNLIKSKKIKLIVVSKGNKLKIENNIFIDILWPDNKKIISENQLNNNSLVCNLHYKNFSMLFTGDIEEIAEKTILKEYKSNLQMLKADIIKVPHHGSKSSSSNDFIEVVNPKIALIGVGEKNKFGHPSDEVVERMDKRGLKIFRTDKMGEISIIVNRSGKVKDVNFCK